MFIGQSQQRAGTQSAHIYSIHTPTMHCMVTGSKAFRHWPNMLSIYMLRQGVGCVRQVIFSCWWYCPLAGENSKVNK